MKMCFHYHYFQVMLSIFDRRENIAKLFRLFLGTFVSLRLIRRKATQCAPPMMTAINELTPLNEPM